MFLYEAKGMKMCVCSWWFQKPLGLIVFQELQAAPQSAGTSVLQAVF